MKRQPIPGINSFKSSTATANKIVSCKKCRLLKRKCSRDRPACNYCNKHGIPCEYDSDDSFKSGIKSPRVLDGLDLIGTPNGFVGSSARYDAVHEDRNEAAGGGEKGHGQDHSQDHKPHRSPSSNHRSVFSIQLIITNTSGPENGSKYDLDSNDGASRKYSDTSLSQRSQTPQVPQAQLVSKASPISPDPSTPIFPASHWSLYKHSDDNLHPRFRSGPVFTNIFHCSLNEQDMSLNEDLNLLLSFVPERPVCDDLFNRYRCSIHPVIPVLDIEAIGPAYESFWDNKSKGDLKFYIQLFTILYAGAVSEFESFTLNNNSKTNKSEFNWHVDRMKHLVGATEIALTISKFPNEVSILGLQSTVVLHYVLRNDCKTDDCSSIANLVRLAQLIELNRDPLNYHGIDNKHDVQLRRILWWQILYLDCVSSLSSKLSPIINEHEYDTQFPNEYFQTYKGEYKFNPIIGFINGKYHWAKITSRIVKQGFNLDIESESSSNYWNLEESINNFSIYCSGLIQKIVYSEKIIMPEQEQFMSFSSTYISTLPDRCYIILRLMFPDNQKGKTRRRFVDTSSISKEDMYVVDDRLTRLQIHLLEGLMKYGSMPENRLFLWEIRKFQPIQTLLSLLRDLISEFRKILSPTSALLYNKVFTANENKIDCINRTFNELDYLSRHTSPLCVERWNLLKDLKRSVWEQLFEKVGGNNYPNYPSPRSDNSSGEGRISGSDGVRGDGVRGDGVVVPAAIPGGPGSGSGSGTTGVTGGEVIELSENELNDILREMDSYYTVINDNMNIRVWDKLSGHYLE